MVAPTVGMKVTELKNYTVSCLSMSWNQIIIDVSFFLLCHGVDDALHASPTSNAGLPLKLAYTTIQKRISKH